MNIHVYRFNSLGTAEHFRQTADAGYATLLGDDETFWVPETNRETARLIRAGYQMAIPRDNRNRNPGHIVIPHGLRAHIAETADGFACLLIEDIATGAFLDSVDLQRIIDNIQL